MGGAERRRELLDIAAHSFARHGYGGTTLREITRLAEISEPAIYRHFNSKESLFRAAVAEAPKALLEGWREIQAVAPPSEWLEAMGEQYERQLDTGQWSLALQLYAAGHSEAMRELVRVNTAFLHDFVRQAVMDAQAAGTLGGSRRADAVATEFLSAAIRRRVERLLGIKA